MATDKGFSAIPLRMGEEAVRTAIHEALSVIEGSRREKQRNELLNCMIEMMEEGIVALDSQGTILKINQICMEMLHLRRKNVVGLPAKTVLDVREDNSIIKLSSRNVLVRRNPIVIDGETEGTVIMLQYVEALQKAEIAVRQKLNEKGLVAKYYFQDIIGSSAPLQKAVEQAKRFAKTDSDILIIGESGTGKELFAQSIHNASQRKNGPFVAINCAAVSNSLLESMVFAKRAADMIAKDKEEKPAFDPQIDLAAYPDKTGRQKEFKDLILGEIKRKDKAFYDKWCNDENMRG